MRALRWPRVKVRSTRTRVLGWFMFIVAIALGLNIVVVDRFLHAQTRAAITTELRHEVVKFRAYAQRAIDPSTGRSFAKVEPLLRSYLAEAVPDHQEALFSVVNGRPAHRTRNQVPTRLDRRHEVITTASRATKPVTRTVDTARGTALYSVVPVAPGGGRPPAALVIAEFTHEKHAEVVQVVRVTALASAAALVIAGAISWFVAGRILAPLRHVRRTAEAIGESDLTQRIEIALNAGDDVTRLALTFNGMLDRLESVFAAQRAFLHDAAHELRTPLTVIRGHLELMDQETPTEQAQTQALLLEELGRMNRIVDDLLVLAAADRPDFLTLGEVDLTDLVVGALARADALASRHWSVSETADAVVLADGQRLTQALVQLCANAVRFTSDGDQLSIGSALHNGQVVLTVRDTGVGIPDEFKEQVFHRFVHWGQQHSRGAGLGLAIVRSIAGAHGGDVAVRDTPGGGATFTVGFPARYPGSADGWGHGAAERGDNHTTPGREAP